MEVKTEAIGQAILEMNVADIRTEITRVDSLLKQQSPEEVIQFLKSCPDVTCTQSSTAASRAGETTYRFQLCDGLVELSATV